jgi:Collagen triple helix repeat (20 copies)
MRKRLSYANITATLALVFAMSGGAMAANSYLINSTKQINPKVLKKLTGKPGKNGIAGANGATGATGPTGPAGSPGTAGAKGETGLKGEKGETGLKGEAGLSALSTLPAGDSESGVVAPIESNPTSSRSITGTVTFPVPMPEALAESHVIFLKEGVASAAHCSGQGHAEAGYLCIYVAREGDVGTTLSRNIEGGIIGGAGKLGLVAFWNVTTSGDEAYAEATWTVTAN